jgi:Domain of Unknown Function with PDB structure (DUF3857)/Transglutaminase-like superfamily
MKDSASRLHTMAGRLMFLIVILTIGLEVSASEPKAQKIERGEFSFQLGPTPAWVKPMPVAAQWEPNAPGASAARWRNWLVDDQTQRLKGRRIRYYDRAYEPVSAEMLTDAGKFQTQFSPEFQTLTVHEVSLRRAGIWQDRLNLDRITLARREADFEEDMATGSVSAMFLLDDVRAGDVVRVRYSIEGENPILAGLDTDGAGFAWADPTLDRQFRVLFDPGAAPVEFRDPRVAAAKIKKTATHLEWRYSAHAIAELRDEGGYPPWYIAYPFVNVSEKRSWREVATWAMALYPKPKALPADLMQRVEAWRKLPSLDAKVTAALSAVQEDVRYFGVEIGDNTHQPAEPAEVWARRRGDCKDKSRLLVAILNALGIDANPALVNAQSGKAIGDFPPAASQFDHVIVQVRDGSKSLWLDPTRTQQRGPASAQDIGDFGVALPVTGTTKALVKVDRNPDFIDSIQARERVELDAKGSSADLEVRTEYQGAAANRMRYELAVNGADTMSRRYEDLYRRRYGEVTAKQAMQVSDDAEKNRIVVTEHYGLVEPWASITSGERSIDFYADHIGGAVSLPTTMARKTPLAMRHPQQSQHRIEVHLPKGWQWKGETETQNYNDKAALFSTQRGEKDGVVFVEQKYASQTSVIETERMAEHLRWRREVGDAVSPRLVLALPVADAARAQNKRLNSLIRDVIEDNQKQGKPEQRND